MKAHRTSHGSFLTLLLVGAVGAGACMSASSSNGTGTSTGNGTGAGGQANGGSSGSPTGSGGTAVVTGAGGTTGAAGVTGTGTGGTGTTVSHKACFTKVTPMNPVLLDFENYNGMTDPAMYGTAFGGATPNTGTAYAGYYAYGDGTVNPTTALLGGHPPSNWALQESITAANGMGGGFWMGCADLSAYKGISFWVRGTAPPGVFSFGVVMESTAMPDATDPAAGGTCLGTEKECVPATKNEIPLTADWTQITIMWSDFTPGLSVTTPVPVTGDNIIGFLWTVPVNYVLAPGATDPLIGPYVPVPDNLLIDFDDVQFIP